MNGKFLLYFLIALLSVFIIQGILFGIFLFVTVIKYMIIAGLIAGVVYLFSQNKKRE